MLSHKTRWADLEEEAEEENPSSKEQKTDDGEDGWTGVVRKARRERSFYTEQEAAKLQRQEEVKRKHRIHNMAATLRSAEARALQREGLKFVCYKSGQDLLTYRLPRGCKVLKLLNNAWNDGLVFAPEDNH